MPAMRTRIVSTWDLDTFEDRHAAESMPNGIVSTWNLDTFEGYGGWVKDDFMFINLGSGELRGLVCRADHSLGHCINLESVHLRGLKFLGDVECLDCINLGSGHLRGLQVDAQVRSRNCINLGPGRPRTLEVREQLGVVIVSAWNLFAVENQPCIGRKQTQLYQPGIWTPSRTLE